MQKRQKHLNSQFEIIGRPLAEAIVEKTEDYEVAVVLQHRRYRVGGDMAAYMQRSIVYPRTGIVPKPSYEVLALIDVRTWLLLEEAIYTRRPRGGENSTAYEYFRSVYENTKEENDSNDPSRTEDRSTSDYHRG